MCLPRMICRSGRISKWLTSCDAARVCVDEGMFVPARTLSVAVARMNDGEGDNIDIIQAQFLRSLSA